MLAIRAEFTQPLYTVVESDPSVEVCLELSGSFPIEEPLFLDVATADGTAVGMLM